MTKHLHHSAESGDVARLPRRRNSGPWEKGEPTLADLMTDSVLLAVLRRDRLSVDEVWTQVLDARAKLLHAMETPLSLENVA